MSFPDSIEIGPYDVPGVTSGRNAKVCRRLAYPLGKPFGPVANVSDFSETVPLSTLEDRGKAGSLPDVQNGVHFEFYVPPGSPAREGATLVIAKQRWTLNEFRRFGGRPSTVTEYDNWPEAFAAMVNAGASGLTAVLVAPPKVEQVIRLGLAAPRPGRFIDREALKAARAAHVAESEAAASTLHHS